MPFGSLWIPVVVSTVAVWLVSAILHMALKYHKADYKGVSNEDEVAAALRKGISGPGLYVLPHCSDMSQLKDPAVIAKYEKGPVAMMSVMPSGAPKIGKHLSMWVIYLFAINFILGYILRHTLNAGTDGHTVLRVAAAIAFLPYVMGEIVSSIWKSQPWGNTARGAIDGLIYAVVTGLCFMWLWPHP